MNKKNKRREILLAVGLIGLLGYPVVTLNRRLLADTGLADRTVAAAQSSSSLTQATENQVSITFFSKKVGDVDDAERIQRAVDYCSENGKDLFFTSGTEYTLRSVEVEAGLHLIGYGATFRLAERQPKLTRMFTTQQHMWESDDDSDYLIFEGMTFDGNCWEQGAFLNYEKEQQFAILFSGSTEKAGMLRGKVIACRFENWCGDGVHVYTNTAVTVSNSTSCNCFRGGVVASGSPSTIKITDFVAEQSQFGKAMDIEIETNPRNKTTLTIEKLTAYESVDLGTQEGAVVKMTDSTIIGGKTVIYGFKNKITIERSTLSEGHRTADEIRISLLNANCKTPNSRRIPHSSAVPFYPLIFNVSASTDRAHAEQFDVASQMIRRNVLFVHQIGGEVFLVVVGKDGRDNGILVA